MVLNKDSLFSHSSRFLYICKLFLFSEVDNLLFRIIWFHCSCSSCLTTSPYRLALICALSILQTCMLFHFCLSLLLLHLISLGKKCFWPFPNKSFCLADIKLVRLLLCWGGWNKLLMHGPHIQLLGQRISLWYYLLMMWIINDQVLCCIFCLLVFLWLYRLKSNFRCHIWVQFTYWQNDSWPVARIFLLP